MQRTNSLSQEGGWDEESSKLARNTDSQTSNIGSNPDAILPIPAFWIAGIRIHSYYILHPRVKQQDEGIMQDNEESPANAMRGSPSQHIYSFRRQLVGWVCYLSILQDGCWIHGTAWAVPVRGQQQHHFPGMAILIWQRGRACNQVRTITHR